MKLIINKEKRIGKVIYVVEGDETEPEIVEQLFRDFLGYSVVKYDKRDNSYTELVSDRDKYSRVYIVPSQYSAIKKISKSADYFDQVFSTLATNYELDVTNNAVYFLFDRDRVSNRPTRVMEAITALSNSRDSVGYGMNGLLLLSYPSIEAFYCNINNDNEKFSSGNEAKNYVEKYSDETLNDVRLIDGAECVLNKVLSIVNEQEFNLEWLDSFSSINEKIFNYEEMEYNKSKLYDTLSLLFISLLDLGIIEIE